jgi:hypothetical protein
MQGERCMMMHDVKMTQKIKRTNNSNIGFSWVVTRAAMEDELQALHLNNIWRLIPP